MRTDNRNVKATIIFIYFFLLMGAILLATLFSNYNTFSESSIYVFLTLFVILIFVHFSAKYFEYNSDGQKLVLINKGLILTDYINYREHKVELVKHKLLSYKTQKYLFYKTLVLFIKHRNGKISKERFNVTLLKRAKLRHVKQSLRRIIKENLKHSTSK
ncbi:hypothetical protein FBALC1_09437 [Flavobacteriales bacterium ALC-1]|nr:hypothetical protein FBALC1_09437 [Flavobacteriales bacterium ALC-1]